MPGPPDLETPPSARSRAGAEPPHPPTHETVDDRRLPVLRIVAWLAATRAAMVLIAAVSLAVAPKGPFWEGRPTFSHWFVRWDVNWYLDIIRHGYTSVPGTTEHQQSGVAFFPLYPVLVRFLSLGVLPRLLVAFVVANALLLGAALLLWKLVRLDHDGTTAGRAVWFLLLCPVAIFFSIPYSESTFLACLVATMWFARRRQWWLAGLAGALAALARSVGILLVVPLALEYLDPTWRPFRLRRRPRWDALACLLPVAGFATYAAYLWWRFDEPLAMVHAQSAWGRRLSPPWVPFTPGRLQPFPPFHRVWFVVFAVLAVVGLVAAVRLRIRPSYTVLAALLVASYVSATHLEALPRLLSVVFPFYLVLALASRGRRWAFATLSALSGACLVLTTAMFVNGWWMT